MDGPRACVCWTVLVALSVLAGCEAMPEAQAVPGHTVESRITIPMHEVFPPGNDAFAVGGHQRLVQSLAALPARAPLSVTVYGTNDFLRHSPPSNQRRLNEGRAATVEKGLRSLSGGAWTVERLAVKMIDGKAAGRRIEIVAVSP